MADPFVAVVVSVPEEYFSDDDDICLGAGKFVCARLESHLIRTGHSIPDWVKGGCEEDWGVYYESHRDSERFDYAICFFDVSKDEVQREMLVQYGRRIPFLKSLFTKPDPLGPNHHLHHTMQEFGKTFGSSRMLTKPQLEAEY